MSFYKREDPDPEDWTPTHAGRRTYLCRDASCRKILTTREARFFAGWPWCREHYREVTELAMRGQDVVDVDVFNRSRR